MSAEFDILAAKSLAHEASPAEEGRLRELLTGNSQLAEEFELLKSTWDLVRETGPTARALNASALPIPGSRLRDLQKIVRDEFGSIAGSERTEQADAPLQSPLRQRGTGVRNIAASTGGAPSHGRPWLLSWWETSWSRVALSAAAVLVFVASVTYWPRTPHRVSSLPGGTSKATVAYLLPTQGQPNVRRAGKLISCDSAVRLIFQDQLELRAGSAARLILPRGTLDIHGPKSLSAEDLSKELERQNPPLGVSSVGPVKNEALLQAALFAPAHDLLRTNLLLAMRSGPGIPLYSPLGSSARRDPLLIWKAEAGLGYDVAMHESLNPSHAPSVLTNVSSPLELGRFPIWRSRIGTESDLYRIVIQESGKPFTACEYSFRSVPVNDDGPAASPSERLGRAYTVLEAGSERVGDVLADLLTLPRPHSDSEFSLRLQLYIFGRLGYSADYAAVAARIQSTASEP